MKTPFQHTQISEAINGVPPRLWREPTEATPDATTKSEVATPMQDAQTTQPETAERGWLADLDWQGKEDSAEMTQAAVFEADPKLEQFALVKTIGARMREAREICNMSQSVAAQRLGYSNPSKLSKVEHSSDTNSVPLWLIVRASILYEVSTDFLMGLNDDWQIGVPRGVSGWLMGAWEVARRNDLILLERLHRRIDAVSRVVPELAAGIEETAGAVARFREVNIDFDEMKCGARVEGCIERLQASANAARLMLKRFHLELAGQTAAPETSTGGRYVE